MKEMIDQHYILVNKTLSKCEDPASFKSWRSLFLVQHLQKGFLDVRTFFFHFLQHRELLRHHLSSHDVKGSWGEVVK